MVEQIDQVPPREETNCLDAEFQDKPDTQDIHEWNFTASEVDEKNSFSRKASDQATRSRSRNYYLSSNRDGHRKEEHATKRGKR